MVELGAKLVVAGSESLSDSLERIGRTLETGTSTMVKSLATAPERVAAEVPGAEAPGARPDRKRERSVAVREGASLE